MCAFQVSTDPAESYCLLYPGEDCQLPFITVQGLFVFLIERNMSRYSVKNRLMKDIPKVMCSMNNGRNYVYEEYFCLIHKWDAVLEDDDNKTSLKESFQKLCNYSFMFWATSAALTSTVSNPQDNILQCRIKKFPDISHSKFWESLILIHKTMVFFSLSPHPH